MAESGIGYSSTAILFCGLLVVGCVPPRPVAHPRIDIPPPPTLVLSMKADEISEYAPYQQASGECSVTGQAFMRQIGGGVVFAAGSDVELIPWTTYFDRAATQTVEMQALHNECIRRVVADGHGEFRFDRVPCGRWVILTTVSWSVPNKYGWLEEQGGGLAKRVELRPGETLRIVLTRR